MESFTAAIGIDPAFSPLVPPILYIIVALLALLITVLILNGHARVLRARLKLDLFEKRYEFLQVIRSITSLTLGSEGRYFDKVQKDYAKFAHFKLLFPIAIAKQVDRLIAACDELFFSSEAIRSMPLESGGSAEQKRNDQLRKEILADMEALQRKIEDFIRVDWQG